ncbi:hypothetical protein Tsubulata_042077 [Turnera subulata]|uniref:Uncharacterized protein n=1 Tax=Turnera subulata TaxID=218843 RepID=A0A9Q0JAA5_9ROSI|nr:hypothetical protein Tsubulata_026744 [Turnera subulata]KAJ4833927.1 hypothetical protein Tsubulata_049759 [Turnera subulata]KAJ4850727.1 hypothetical protein Tsubulata_042077 [Turnera subulata]
MTTNENLWSLMLTSMTKRRKSWQFICLIRVHYTNKEMKSIKMMMRQDRHY